MEGKPAPWYYQIELEPGRFGPGKPRSTMGWLADYMDRIDLSGARCIDIGTQEGATPVNLIRHGASSVTGYDRQSLCDRIDAVRGAYGVQFDYVHGIEIRELKAALSDPVFDVVVFSGVLYHMVDPLVGLAIARSLLREGGIFILETSAFMEEAATAHFNSAARFYGGSTYFQVSAGALDYWLRMLHLSVLDCSYIGSGDVRRVLIVCRAIGSADAEPGDRWMARYPEADLAPYGLRFEDLQLGKHPIAYKAVGGVPRPRTKSIDVWKTLQTQKPYRVSADKCILQLSASPPLDHLA